MSYLVFARKFRPQGFDDVVGQEPIMITLKNAIKQERIPQNFLFSGPRGVGKTSTARILAKALNCAKGPTDNPCNKCVSCNEITQGTSMDVLEIDGASNRGIDEIRNLRETVKFKPVNGRMKIYIIDEVHMLTTEAFNALLKTLEEPPPHVKFIFATTENHKVPLTILSRCHRFQFKRIPAKEIEEKLSEILKKEKIKAGKNALFLIAQAADGSLRDAESLLDQMASFSKDEIKEEDVLSLLGLAAEEVYFSVLSAVKQKDAKKVFKIVEDLYDSGRDLVQFSKGLLEILRHLLLFQCTDSAKEFIEMSKEGIAELEKRKNDFTKSELILCLNMLGSLQGQLRRNMAPPRLLVEMFLLKMLNLEGLYAVEDLLENRASAPAVPQAAAPSYRSPSAAAPVQNYSVPPRPASSARPPVIPPMVTKVAPKQSSAPASEVSEGGAYAAVEIPPIEAFWPRVIEYVKAKRMSTGIFLSESEPIEVAGNLVTLGLPVEFQFHKETLEKTANKQLVEEAFETVLAQKMRVQFVVTQGPMVMTAKKSETAPSAEIAQPAPAAEGDGKKMSEVLSQALNIFQGSKIIRTE